MLDASRSALPQITAALAASRPVSALHVIAHGRPGAVRLGGEELTAEGLDGARAWRASLAPGATIALHACQAGAGEPGRALIEGLAAATGARVAASREDIGAGLPWRLDATSDGLAAAPIVGAAAQAAYPHRLPIPLVAGSETLVNTTTFSDQLNPTVTGLSDGGYVVTWMSYGQDGSSTGVYRRSDLQDRTRLRGTARCWR